MRWRFASGLAPCVLLVTAALRAQTAADSASVTAFYNEWFGSARQGPETYASFYATDGMILPPNAAQVVGRPAIAEWMRRSQAALPYSVRPEGIKIDEMRFLSPTWVMHRSTLHGQRVPKAGGDPMPFETKYVDLLHRTGTGRWEVAYRMWSDTG